MIATVLALAWFGLVVVLVGGRRRPPPRVAALLAPSSPTAARPSPAGALGRLLRGAAGRPPDPAADRRTGTTVLAAVVAGAVSPLLAVAAGSAVWLAPVVQASRARRRHDDAVLADLPEVVDLVALAVGAGLTVPLAVAAVAERAPGGLGAALRQVAGAIALGRRAADAVDELPALAGEAVRPLSAALAASDRYGVALGPSLAVLGAEVRADRRRRAEATARRVPVQLLFPLVVCVLPAFGLLTVVPLLAGAATSLRL